MGNTLNATKVAQHVHPNLDNVTPSVSPKV